MGRHGIMVAALGLLLAGCATPSDGWRTLAPAGETARCLARFEDADRRVASAGVGDAQAARVAGFPYLRVSRFLASFRHEMTDATIADWAQRLAALDAEARAAEMQNLGAADESGDLDRCRAYLVVHDLASPAARAALQKAARAPDDYDRWQRLLGFYPLTAMPIAAGAFQWRQREARDIKGPAAALPIKGKLVDYAPPLATATAIPDFAALPRDGLGMPQLSADDKAALLAAHAPALVVDEATTADRIGALAWSTAGKPLVDGATPVAYTLLSHTRYRGRVLIQLVYAFWFAERPKRGPIDLLGGVLDGLIWRVTLDENGQPLLYDSIHPCGCYHLFFPVADWERRDRWSLWHEGSSVPQRAPALAQGERLAVRLAAGTHYIKDIEVTTGGAAARRYELRDYDGLRALPLSDGRTRSLFRPDGLVAGTARGERFLFWPMGIKSAGAMRQWGRHATAFVGVRHFDDPDLIEATFRVSESQP